MFSLICGSLIQIFRCEYIIWSNCKASEVEGTEEGLALEWAIQGNRYIKEQCGKRGQMSYWLRRIEVNTKEKKKEQIRLRMFETLMSKHGFLCLPKIIHNSGEYIFFQRSYSTWSELPTPTPKAIDHPRKTLV